MKKLNRKVYFEIQKYNEYIYRRYVREENFRISCILFLFMFYFVIDWKSRRDMLHSDELKYFLNLFLISIATKLACPSVWNKLLALAQLKISPIVGRFSSRDNEDLPDVRTDDHTST